MAAVALGLGAGAFAVCEAPLRVLPKLYPVSGLVDTRFNGFVYRTRIGVYIALDKDCQNPISAYIPDNLENKNKDELSKLDSGLNINNMPLAQGVYTGRFKRFDRGRNREVYFEMRRMDITRVATTFDLFPDPLKCDVESGGESIF